jgi:hypothetical protein
MEPTLNNMHFLWAAYLVVAIANIGFVLWLKKRWNALSTKGEHSAAQSDNGPALK